MTKTTIIKVSDWFSHLRLRKYWNLVKKINSLEPKIEALTDADLLRESQELKKKISENGAHEEETIKAFALTREAAKRTLGQRHFDVQLIGGLVLNEGKIAEMVTGEGKTLAATLPAYLNALSGKGVHIITVNDYLAKRDTVWMGQIFSFLGLSVSCLTHEASYLYDGEKLAKDAERDEKGGFKVVDEFLRQIPRREAYAADITYGPNHEFGFDYLRDNLVINLEEQVEREPLHYAIIDEVDSILIDEARTPLIISAPDAESSEYYRTFARVVRDLKEGEDYTKEEKTRESPLTEKGIDKVQALVGVKDLFSFENLRLVHYLETSLKAKLFYQRDKDYIVKNGEVIIVDEFTGRLLPGRRYSGGIHQAIEAKEGVFVRQENRTLAEISIQNYFRLYRKLAGMTGTAQTSAEEFHKVYNLEAVSIPTNRPMIRKSLPDVIYRTRETKLKQLTAEIRKRNAAGQPVLVGTASITQNEIISELLRESDIPHQVLNAKHHETEGQIIAQAGRLKAVTVATNMAGRGVDIVLGGNPPDAEEAQKVKELGGLHVIGTERNEARRIDNQLRGRSGRQGDAGSSQFFLSLEDDLMRIFGGERLRNLMKTLNIEDLPIESRIVSRAVAEAQKKVEGINFDLRRHLLDYDDVVNKQRLAIYKKRQLILQAAKNGTVVEFIKENFGDDWNKEDSGLAAVVLLRTLDSLWMNHLEALEALRESVGIRAYGQHDPLIEFRREAHIIFGQLKAEYERLIKESKERLKELKEKSARPVVIQPGVKIGRNDPCPCGSKKKYKRCHGT